MSSYSTDKAANAARDIADAASDHMQNAQGMAQEQMDRMAAAIRRSPLQAAGVAAGIGFFLAVLARR